MQRITFSTLLGAVSLLGAMSQVQADDRLGDRRDDPLTFELAIGFDRGGDDIAIVAFEDADDEELTAGDGFFLQLGAGWAWLDTPQRTELTLGFKSDRVDASNGEVTFSRVTLNAMQSFMLSDRFSIAGGVTYHVEPEFEVELDSTVFNGSVTRSTTLDSALGFVVEADYWLTDIVAVGVRGTFIDYEIDGQDDVDGDSVGLYLSLSI